MIISLMQNPSMYSHCQKDSEISQFAIDVLQTAILNGTSYIRNSYDNLYTGKLTYSI
jgi:hypothetical protein